MPRETKRKQDASTDAEPTGETGSPAPLRRSRRNVPNSFHEVDDHEKSSEKNNSAAAKPSAAKRLKKKAGEANINDIEEPAAKRRKKTKTLSKTEEDESIPDEKPHKKNNIAASKPTTATSPSKKTDVKTTDENADKSSKTRKKSNAPSTSKGNNTTGNGKPPTTESTPTTSHGDQGTPRPYWLMKAEPDSRLENGIDVKFSIDDLKACTVPEPWEGVRNHVAKNNMIAMRRGDLSFFYHSNTKIPGIAGIMEIVEESSVDKSALDPKHPYFDPKSDPEKPRWFNVHVCFKRKFAELITLKELQLYKGPNEPLTDMQLLKQSRLSVSRVSGPEWDFIMGIVEKREAGGDA